MAATAKLLQLRPKTLPVTATTTTPAATSVHFFASSTTPDPDNAPYPQPELHPPPPQSQSQSSFSFSSYLSDVKASLKQQQPQQSQRNLQSQRRQKPFSFASPTSNQSDQIEEIRKNLQEFRLRSAPPLPTAPPPSSSVSSTTSAPNSFPPISFQELFKRNLASKGQESAPGASGAAVKPQFDAIRESLKQLKYSSTNHSQGGGTTNNPMPMSRWKESLTTRPLDSTLQSSQQRVYGGRDSLPQSIFGPEMKEKEGDSTKIGTEFVRTYSTRDLGEKLRALRPERRDKKDWFSFEELSERLAKLREMEENERNSKLCGTYFDLRKSLQVLSKENAEPKRHRVDILGQLGRTPVYKSPPKEELVEKYFHPDHMSAAEKLKLELGKVRDEFKLSESDCGSARVQVAQLTTKIKHLSTVLHKKDKHSRKGLEAMVQRRKKLLKYLRRTDWDSYCFVLSKLGLRDHQDDYAKKKNYPSKKDHSGKKKALKT